jgi:hypothetical protein
MTTSNPYDHSTTFFGSSLAEVAEKIIAAAAILAAGTVLTTSKATATQVVKHADTQAISTNDAARIAKTDALIVPPTDAAKAKADKAAAKVKKAADDAAAAALAAAAAAATAPDVLDGEAEEPADYTLADVRTALGELRDLHGKNRPNLLVEFIKQFGVAMASQLKPEQFAEVIGAANKYVPE